MQRHNFNRWDCIFTMEVRPNIYENEAKRSPVASTRTTIQVRNVEKGIWCNVQKIAKANTF